MKCAQTARRSGATAVIFAGIGATGAEMYAIPEAMCVIIVQTGEAALQRPNSAQTAKRSEVIGVMLARIGATFAGIVVTVAGMLVISGMIVVAAGAKISA